MLIRLQVSKPERAANRDCLENGQSPLIFGKNCRPHLRGIASPEQSMLIGTDCPENWTCQAGEGSNDGLIRTECVNEKVVLDFVHVPRVRLV